jgi:hypothetical protein
MGFFSKLLKDTKIGKFLKKVGITIGEEKRKVKKKTNNCDFSDNHDDDNWTY